MVTPSLTRLASRCVSFQFYILLKKRKPLSFWGHPNLPWCWKLLDFQTDPASTFHISNPPWSPCCPSPRLRCDGDGHFPPQRPRALRSGLVRPHMSQLKEVHVGNRRVFRCLKKNFKSWKVEESWTSLAFKSQFYPKGKTVQRTRCEVNPWKSATNDQNKKNMFFQSFTPCWYMLPSYIGLDFFLNWRQGSERCVGGRLPATKAWISFHGTSHVMGERKTYRGYCTLYPTKTCKTSKWPNKSTKHVANAAPQPLPPDQDFQSALPLPPPVGMPRGNPRPDAKVRSCLCELIFDVELQLAQSPRKWQKCLGFETTARWGENCENNIMNHLYWQTIE